MAGGQAHCCILGELRVADGPGQHRRKRREQEVHGDGDEDVVVGNHAERREGLGQPHALEGRDHVPHTHTAAARELTQTKRKVRLIKEKTINQFKIKK